MSLPSPARLVNRLHPHARGRLAEQAALLYFLARGYLPAARPRRAPTQTDLLLRRGSALLVVEVKYRPSEEKGHRALSPAQAARLRREATRLAALHPALAVRADTLLVFPAWPFFRHVAEAIPLAD
jgi:putative endonuclease